MFVLDFNEGQSDSPTRLRSIANIVDPDQTALWIWVYTVCPDLSVQKLKIVKGISVLQQTKRGKKNTKQRKKARQREKPKDKPEPERDESPVLEEVSKDDGLAFAMEVAREESPICIEDDEIVLSDSNSMDVEVKIIEETTPVKMPPMHQVKDRWLFLL